MAYYWFNRCEESKLGEVEGLAKELLMEERECESPARKWWGNKDSEGRILNSDGLFAIFYDPQIPEWPLMIQTVPDKDYRDEKIRGIIKKIVDITGSTRVGDFIFRDRVKDLDIKELM